jgi:hypothetical protein
MDDGWREGPLPPAEVRRALSAALGGLEWATTDVAHALKAFDLIFPELIEYRGGWFRASRFDEANVDAWFKEFNGDVAGVERMINHLDVLEDDPRGPDSGEYETEWSNALGEVLAYTWPLWAKEMYGIDVQSGVAFVEEATDEGPDPQTVTFWTVKKPG